MGISLQLGLFNKQNFQVCVYIVLHYIHTYAHIPESLVYAHECAFTYIAYTTCKNL